jgi:hypothetical protein
LRVVQCGELPHRFVIHLCPPRLVPAQALNGLRVARPDLAEQLAGVLLLLFQIHGTLLHRTRGPPAGRKRSASFGWSPRIALKCAPPISSSMALNDQPPHRRANSDNATGCPAQHRDRDK